MKKRENLLSVEFDIRQRVAVGIWVSRGTLWWTDSDNVRYVSPIGLHIVRGQHSHGVQLTFLFLLILILWPRKAEGKGEDV